MANPYNPYGDDKVIAACSIFGMMDTSGRRFSGADVTRAIANMHDRGNGLGGGFGVYGIYPEHADKYALHIMFEDSLTRRDVEAFLRDSFHIAYAEEVPTRPARGIVNPPVVWRYFVSLNDRRPGDLTEDDLVVQKIMQINTTFSAACVFSSGKNMGVFKGVGYPEDISAFFRLDEYEGYLWTAHGRFPTNTKGWWGGAHPFSILDWTVVHNGEISSYGINRRYLEMFGYHCTMHTDTEVVAYAVDLLLRRHNLPMEIAAKVFAPPLWSRIDRLEEGSAERALLTTLRQVYSSLLLNGPFTVIIAHEGEMIGLTDRIRLRPLIAGTKGDVLYLSSEEAAIRLICPDLEQAWSPMGGEPIVGRLKTDKQRKTAPAKEWAVV
ncbi:MAG: glutamine amidotransferase family protein [Chloroflexi bacterium]|nr:glutamine amidotransferase family protein [Chloroflexota bacterium]